MKAANAQLDPTAQRLFDRLVHHPLLLQRYQAMERQAERDAKTGSRIGAPRILTPEDVIGEQLTYALMVLQAPMTVLNSYHKYEALSFTNNQRLRLATDILSAAPYLWEEDMRKLALANSMPPHVVGRDVLPFKAIWWTFPGSVPVTSPDFDLKGWDMDTVLLVDRGGGTGGLEIFALGVIGATQVGLLVDQISYGQKIPEDVKEGTQGYHMLNLLSFLSAPLVAISKRLMNRGERRRLLRSGHPPAFVNQEVHFVNLRIPERTPSTSNDPMAREWTRRWLVRGHRRAQWYPSEQGHRLIWVTPYVKGPADKPFVPSVYRVIK